MKITKPISQVYWGIFVCLLLSSFSVSAKGNPFKADSLRKAGRNGNGDAYFLLSEWFRMGSGGLTANNDSSKYYVELAAEKGQKEALYLVGIATLRGVERPRDEIKGIEILLKAGEKDHRQALETLTRYFADSSDLFKKRTMPLELEQKIAYIHARNAARLGSPSAAEVLGNAYLRGQGTAKNDTLAIVWMTTAALGGIPTAQMTLASWYFNGTNPAVKADLYKALKYYTLLSQNRAADIDLKTEGRIGIFYCEQMLRMVIDMHYLFPLSGITQAPQLRVRQ